MTLHYTRHSSASVSLQLLEQLFDPNCAITNPRLIVFANKLRSWTKTMGALSTKETL